MLVLYKRTFFGVVTNDENNSLLDLNAREKSGLYPLVFLVILLGVYPKPILEPIDNSVKSLVSFMESKAISSETKEFLKDKKLAREPKFFYSDPDANYKKVIEIDVSKLEPVIAYPHLPSNGHSLSQAIKDDIRVDQVFIGSCTNGRLSDIETAAKIVKGKKVARHTRMIVTPATQKILEEASKLGYIKDLVDAGAVVSNPTCGACLGGYMGILGDDEVAISTTNRNFVGRMGARSSKIYLSNSAIAAASAIAGKIAHPNQI